MGNERSTRYNVRITVQLDNEIMMLLSKKAAEEEINLNDYISSILTKEAGLEIPAKPEKAMEEPKEVKKNFSVKDKKKELSLFSRNVRYLRQAFGMTQKELAEAIFPEASKGSHRNIFYLIESDYNPVSDARKKLIGQFFGFTIDEITNTAIFQQEEEE